MSKIEIEILNTLYHTEISNLIEGSAAYSNHSRPSNTNAIEKRKHLICSWVLDGDQLVCQWVVKN